MYVSHQDVKVRLDLAGLHCPVPVISCRAALSKLNPGDCLEVIVTDKDALREIPQLVKNSGEQLLGYEVRANRLHLFIIKQSIQQHPVVRFPVSDALRKIKAIVYGRFNGLGVAHGMLKS